MDAGRQLLILTRFAEGGENVRLRRCFSAGEDDAGDERTSVLNEVDDRFNRIDIDTGRNTNVVTVKAPGRAAAQKNNADRSTVPIHGAHGNEPAEVAEHGYGSALILIYWLR